MTVAGGTVYVLDPGAGRVLAVAATGGPARRIGYWTAKPTAVAADPFGNVYVGDVSGNVWKVYPDSHKELFARTQSITSLAYDPTGAVEAGTRRNGVVRFDAR